MGSSTHVDCGVTISWRMSRYTSQASRVCTTISSPTTRFSMYKKGALPSVRCPTTAKFPAMPGVADDGNQPIPKSSSVLEVPL